MIGKCCCVVRNQGEIAGQIFLKVLLSGDTFSFLGMDCFWIDKYWQMKYNDGIVLDKEDRAMKRIIRHILALSFFVVGMFGNANIAMAAPLSQPQMTDLTFDMDYYYDTYPDLQTQIGYDYNGLYNHYIMHGLQEGRWGSEDFNCLIYKNNYSDLQAVFGNNYDAYCIHYETYGKIEGRNAKRDITKEKKNWDVPGDAIGSYSTLYDATVPRATNISIATSRINGVTVWPGESFSFSQTILPRTAENGYVEAPVIAGSGYVQGLGGGICQVSSTLYAAMLNANLPATERHAHSLVVSYIPVGMDATISENIKDLKFTNTFDEPIQICAVANDGVLTISICK